MRPMGSSWLHALRVAGPAILVAGSAWPSPVVDVFTLTLTGDRLLGLAAVPVVIIMGLRREWHWTYVHTALLVFVAAQILTTLLNAVTWSQGPRFVVIYVMGFACFALAAEWARGLDGQRRMASAWTAVAAAVSVAGAVLANLANAFQRPLWGTGQAQVLFSDDYQLVVLFGPRVTLLEWNVFSSFLLVPFTLSLWLWRRDDDPQPARVAALAAMVFGIVTGITRAAWLSAGALVVLWIWTRRPRPYQIAALGSWVVAALLVQALCLGTSPLDDRGLELTTVINRFIISRSTIEAWRAHPLLGSGAGSVNRLPPPEAIGPPTKTWTGNVILFVAHDSGLLGLLALGALVAAVCLRMSRAVRGDAGAPAPSLTVPLLVAGAVLAFTYQFTHGLWLMYPYVYLGFLTAATTPDRGGGRTSPAAGVPG